MSEFTGDLLESLDLQLLETDVKTMLDSEKHLKEVLNEILNWLEYKSRNDILTSILLYNNETTQLFDGLLLHFPNVIAKRSAEIKLVLLLAPVVQQHSLANR
jgi:hypothetical protein